MRFFRCKCGSRTAWSSMGVQTCEVCEECGSTLAESPDTHLEPTEHQWKTQFNQDTGKPEYERCRVCGARRHLPEGPKIICLCGSTRFKNHFVEHNLEETLAGKIVLSIGCDMRSDEDIFGHMSPEEFAETKRQLDELHKRKIDLADEVLILNVGGYIGESTQSELDYAIAHGKFVRMLEGGLTYNSLVEIDRAF